MLDCSLVPCRALRHAKLAVAGQVSSMKEIILPSASLISFKTAFKRSSNSPGTAVSVKTTCQALCHARARRSKCLWPTNKATFTWLWMNITVVSNPGSKASRH